MNGGSCCSIASPVFGVGSGPEFGHHKGKCLSVVICNPLMTYDVEFSEFLKTLNVFFAFF